MCGILGQVSRSGGIDLRTFDAMLGTLIHRGPDGSGLYVNETRTVALGHRRLSILDLSDAGRQPMSSGDGAVALTFNGEIYNYREIRAQLEQSHRFTSGTDTEVILQAYMAWGLERTLQSLNGMFAFGLYDKRLNRLYCVRDRLGIKPLIFHSDVNSFLFASEIKALRRSPLVSSRLDPSAIRDYLLYRYVPHPKTAYSDISKLAPGSWLELNTETLSVTIQKYWDLIEIRNTRPRSSLAESEAVQACEERLNESVVRMLHADVPVDSFLSGGLDSSLIAALAVNHNRTVRAFSIRVASKEHDELASAAMLASVLGIEHGFDTLNETRFAAMCDSVIDQFDEPLGDTSIIPTWLLSSLAAKSTRVALSGDGGDEMFYGYRWYDLFHRELHRDGETDHFERYRQIISPTFDHETVRSLLGPVLRQDSDNGAALFRERLRSETLDPNDLGILDTLTFLVDDNLVRVDVASMAHSLEVRLPYLDHQLVEFLVTLPSQLITKGGARKHLLRTLAARWLPAATIEKPKKGFSTPTLSWLRGDWQQQMQHGRLVLDGVVDRKALTDVLSREKVEGRLWLLYVLERWYSHNF